VLQVFDVDRKRGFVEQFLLSNFIREELEYVQKLRRPCEASQMRVSHLHADEWQDKGPMCFQNRGGMIDSQPDTFDGEKTTGSARTTHLHADELQNNGLSVCEGRRGIMDSQPDNFDDEKTTGSARTLDLHADELQIKGPPVCEGRRGVIDSEAEKPDSEKTAGSDRIELRIGSERAQGIDNVQEDLHYRLLECQTRITAYAQQGQEVAQRLKSSEQQLADCSENVHYVEQLCKKTIAALKILHQIPNEVTECTHNSL